MATRNYSFIATDFTFVGVVAAVVVRVVDARQRDAIQVGAHVLRADVTTMCFNTCQSNNHASQRNWR